MNCILIAAARKKGEGVMRKPLKWTWVGVAVALTMDFLMDFIMSIISAANTNDYFYMIDSVLQTWAIIFFACFGLNKCLKLPFRQRTLWISLACAACFNIIMELFSALMTDLTRYITITSENLMPIVVGSILFSVVSMALLVLAYMLTRLSTEGKSAFALKWNKWLFFAIIFIAGFTIFCILTDFSILNAAIVLNSETNVLSLLSLYSNGKQIMFFAMFFRCAVLYFVSAAALNRISGPPTKNEQEVK